MKIVVTKETKYGKDYIYPYDGNAKAFCKLLGNQKSLTLQNIEDIKALGYTVKLRVNVLETANGEGEL